MGKIIKRTWQNGDERRPERRIRRAKRLTPAMRDAKYLEDVQFDGLLAVKMSEEKLGEAYAPPVHDHLVSIFNSVIKSHDRDEDLKQIKAAAVPRKLKKRAVSLQSGVLAQQIVEPPAPAPIPAQPTERELMESLGFDMLRAMTLDQMQAAHLLMQAVLNIAHPGTFSPLPSSFH